MLGPDAAGTFAGDGVDLRVPLSRAVPTAQRTSVVRVDPGWVRGQTRPEARAEVRVYAAGHDVGAALAHGRRLRAEIDEAVDPVGVLIVADGATR